MSAEDPSQGPSPEEMQMHQQMFADVDAAREATYTGPSHLRQVGHVDSGPGMGRSERIGSNLTGAVVRTDGGSLPSYNPEGPDTPGGYQVAGADVVLDRPTGGSRTFTAERNPSTGKLETKYRGFDETTGESIDKMVAKDVGSRVVSLAARRIARQNTPSKLVGV